MTPASTTVPPQLTSWNALEAAREYARRMRQCLPLPPPQFPVQHAAVTSVVAGMRTASQVKLDLSWFRTEIDETVWTELPPPAR